MSKSWDLFLFTNILAIGAISLSVIYAINKNLALTQGIFWLLGLGVFYITSRISYKYLLELARPLYFFSVVLLISLFLVADPIKGSTRWFDLGFFRVQPSEIAKASVILLLSAFYASKNSRNVKNLITGFLVMAVPAILVFIEPDIGNTMAFFAIWLGLSFASGMKLKDLAIFIALFLTISFLGYELLAQYQRERILTFLDPLKDPLGTGYNIIQAKIAIGSGGFLGKGLSQGSQSQLNFLPEAESDFIFASIAEQLGFLGSGLLITLFITLLIRCMAIAKRAEKVGQLVIIAVVSFLLTQFVVNVGMNLGILPVTGITLPLVSYGGSSLITSLFLLGIIFSIKRFNLS